MEHLVAIMLLVGCSADGSTCTEIPVPTPSYSSVAECQSELGLQMRLSGTYDNRVLGACKAVDEALLEESVTVAWAVNGGGRLLVEIEADHEEAVVASNAPVAAEPLQQLASR